MKLIVCLLIVSLMFASLSSALGGPTTRRVSTKHRAVLEQSQGREVPGLDWRSWAIWSEWLTAPRRGKLWRQERLWLYAFRRWSRERVRCKVRCGLRALGRHGRRGWCWFCRLLQAWLGLVDTMPPAKASAEESRASVPVEERALQRPRPSREGALVPAQGVEASKQPARRGPGRPREIPTDGLCCPNKACSSWGIFGPHPDHDIVGDGTYTTSWAEKRQLYLCKVCGTTSSETAGTLFHHLKTPKEEVLRILTELSEGLGIRAAASAGRMDKDTTLSWLKKGGRHRQRVSEHMMQGLEVPQAQMDELWTFVGKKQRRLSEAEKAHTEQGDTWIWLIFDPVHKLVLAMLVGDRTEKEAKQEYLEFHLHLVLAYYHFVLCHSSLRERLPDPIPTRGDRSPKAWRQQTPAMAAGLTHHPWAMEELLLYQVPAGP